MEWKATANLGLVEEGAVVGEDPVALLEGWLRRVLALALVLLLVVLVAATAARVGVGGAPHGFGSPLAGGEGSGGGAEREGGDGGRPDRGEGRDEGGRSSRAMVTISGRWAVSLCFGLYGPKYNCLPAIV